MYAPSPDSIVKTKAVPRSHAALVALGALLFCPGVMAHPGHDGEDGPDPAPPASQEPEGRAAGAKNEVSITTEGDFRIIQSNGWPDHVPGTFPRKGNPNKLASQRYTFKVPLKPKAEAAPVSRGGWWWGVALNGVPFEPGTAETWNNDRSSGWNYEAGTGFLNLGLDEHNAHVQPNGAYHYHALPNGLVERLGGDGTRMLLIGWAADGYPVYSGWAYSDAKDAKSPLRKMKPGYRLKKGARPQQAGGPGGNYDGRFTQDFEYVKDGADLDDCNGRTGVTPEFPGGTYYYCLTAEFPFVPRAWHGTPDPSFSKGGGPPGGGPRQRPPGGAPHGILEEPDGAPNPPAGPAGGNTPPGPREGGGMNPPFVRAMDLNQDGVIDAGELAKAATSLKSLDRNGDGQLTADEYRPGGGAGRQGGGAPRGGGAPAPGVRGSAPVPAAPPADAAPLPPTSSTSGEKPNVLLIVADDLGWGDVGFHHGNATTPNLDSFVKDGVELQRFYTYPVCSPTRAALLTGQMPRRFGVTTVMGQQQQLPANLVTMPGVFRAAGYATSLVGKWHLGTTGKSIPTEHGFDHFYGFVGGEIDYSKHSNPRGAVDWQRDGATLHEEGYSTYLIADEAIRQIKARDSKRPFLMQVAFNAPHMPQSAPEELVAKYQSLGERATSAAVIEAMDTSIGRILTALGDAKLRDNTIVVFFSDNGATRRSGSNGSLRAGKGTLYEGGIHTPCAVQWPGKLPAGTSNAMPVAVQDLFPTLAAAAGVKIAAKLDGISVWQALRDGRVAGRTPFAIATSDIAVIDGEWKLIDNAGAKRELYHLTKDASESSDEFSSNPAVASRLGATLDSLKASLPAATAPPAGAGGGRRPARVGR